MGDPPDALYCLKSGLMVDLDSNKTDNNGYPNIEPVISSLHSALLMLEMLVVEEYETWYGDGNDFYS